MPSDAIRLALYHNDYSNLVGFIHFSAPAKLEHYGKITPLHNVRDSEEVFSSRADSTLDSSDNDTLGIYNQVGFFVRPEYRNSGGYFNGVTKLLFRLSLAVSQRLFYQVQDEESNAIHFFETVGVTGHLERDSPADAKNSLIRFYESEGIFFPYNYASGYMLIEEIKDFNLTKIEQ